MKYFIANWKMNMTAQDVADWLDNFPGKDNTIIAASFPHLHLIKEKGLATAGQDVSVYEKGAHTGEVGSFQLAELCTYCIIGHSERKEPLETVIKKRDRCLEAGITPIVCFVNPEDCLDLYKPGVFMAWEDPQNISVEGSYRAKDPKEIRTEIQIIKASLPEGAILVYGGSVNRQNIKDLSEIAGLDGVLVGNASLDPQHFYEICKSETSDQKDEN